MKVIITGATGLVGSSLLHDCISNSEITHIFALTRKPLSQELAASQKLTVIIHDEFLDYPPELLKQLVGAEACLWALGGRRPQFPDAETFRKVSVDYTLTAAQAFIAYPAPHLPYGQKFRFVFCSGKNAEWDQTKRLTFMEETRKVKGQCEKGLCDLEDANKDLFEVFAVQPAVILPRDAGCMSKVIGKLYGGIPADILMRGMVRVALHDFPERLIETDKLLEKK
ncbi:hypothetical protein PT974_04755 [Cladobotryum mycophilum]|uniref:NAD(P)-binding domain-containing protein n=1 Tax=Cladobotryum mycophilum TaxID=491253 RepID=A0ABR0SQ82_9HYPO